MTDFLRLHTNLVLLKPVLLESLDLFSGTPHTRATLMTSHRQPVPVPAYEEEIEETGEEFTLEDLEREEARR